MIEDLFFQLLQVAIGTRNTLDRQPTSEEWALLFDMSRKQALLGICFTGVKKLPAVQAPPMEIISQFMFYSAHIQQRNKEVSAACVELVKQYAHKGLLTCILKGQSNLENYPEDLHDARTPGDIDVWCKTNDPSGIDIAVSEIDGKGAHYKRYIGNRAVIEYVKMLHRIAGTEPTEGVRYHHIDAPSINGIEVEAHFRPLFLDSPLRNWRLQRWFRENEQFGVHDFAAGADKTKTLKTPEGNVSNEVSEIVCEHPSSVSSSSTGSNTASSMPSGEKQEINRSGVIPVPTVSFNAVYQLCHIYRHLFDEGIGLRQLLDYYFVLKALEESEHSSKEEIMHTLGSFGMAKFASATMYVLQTVFAMPDEYLICEPNEEEGHFLLNEIMLAGNFGKYDIRIKHGGSQFSHAVEKTKHNLRLLTHYPEEVICEPFFRVYHWVWRKLELWKW